MDCGGAAAMLAAFRAAVLAGGLRRPLHCVLCLAENAIGPGAFRNDDILHIYSGKTVEINNTDAEGRLVLADGVAYACKHLSPGLIVDMATLTGAQLVATGKRHAAEVGDRLLGRPCPDQDPSHRMGDEVDRARAGAAASCERCGDDLVGQFGDGPGP